MPDWYKDALIAKYQFNIDEMAGLKRKHLWNTSAGIDIFLFTAVAFIATGNGWAAFLTTLLSAKIWHYTEAQKRFIVASQILEIEAEWYEVRERVRFPGTKA